MQLAINSYSTANQGYRASARHLIVYVTNTKLVLFYKLIFSWSE